MDVECRVCKAGLLLCCDEHLYCSEGCYNLDSVQHIGVLEGVRGLSNFEGKISAFMEAFANLRDATVTYDEAFFHLTGSLKDMEQRQKMQVQKAQAELQFGKTAYAIGAMMDSIRVSGKGKFGTIPSTAWNAMLTIKLPTWLLAISRVPASAPLDLGPFYDEIKTFLEGNNAADGVKVGLVENINIYMALKGTVRAHAQQRKDFLLSVKKAAKTYDAIYKALLNRAKKETTPDKTPPRTPGKTPPKTLPTPPSGSGLPQGWTEHTLEDGTPYYHNESTGETVWVKPH
jgi:hypothetical protein